MIPSLNGLRGFAAVMVIICHLPIPALIHQHHPFITSIFAAGWLGVPIYFSLSGYLITWLALEEKNTFKDLSLRFFFMRRILRLWPIYIIVCGLSLWIYQFPSFDEIAATPDWIWPLSTFTTNIAITLHKEHFGALGVFWTLALEEQFYLMAGILLKKYQVNVLIVIFSLMILACAIWRFFPVNFSCFLHYRIQLPVSLLSILTGCMLALFQKKWGLNIARKERFWLGLFVLISGFGLLIWEYPFPLNSSHCALIMFVADAFVLALLVLCLAKEGLVQYMMSFPFLDYLGKLSLCIYAINIPVIFFYVFVKEHYLPTSSLLQQHPQWRFLWDTGTIFFLNILLASLWQLIEEPIAELRHRFRPGQNPNVNLNRRLVQSRFFKCRSSEQNQKYYLQGKIISDFKLI